MKFSPGDESMHQAVHDGRMLGGDVVRLTFVILDLEEVVLGIEIAFALDTNQLPFAMYDREPEILGLLDGKEQVFGGKGLPALDLWPYVPAIKGLLVPRRHSCDRGQSREDVEGADRVRYLPTPLQTCGPTHDRPPG